MDVDICEASYCLVTVRDAAAAAGPCLDLKRRRLSSNATAKWTFGAENIHANRSHFFPDLKHDLQPHTCQSTTANQLQRTITTNSPAANCRKRPHGCHQSSQYGTNDGDERCETLRWHTTLPAAASSVVTGYGSAEHMGAGRSSCSSHGTSVTSGGAPTPVRRHRQQLQEYESWQQQQQHPQLLVRHEAQYMGTQSPYQVCASPGSNDGLITGAAGLAAPRDRHLPLQPQQLQLPPRPHMPQQQQQQQSQQRQQLMQMQWDVASGAYTSAVSGTKFHSHAIVTTPYAGADARCGTALPPASQPLDPVGRLSESGSGWWSTRVDAPYGGIGPSVQQQLQLPGCQVFAVADVGTRDEEAAAASGVATPWQHASCPTGQPAAAGYLHMPHVQLPFAALTMSSPSDPVLHHHHHRQQLHDQQQQPCSTFSEQGELISPETPPSQCGATSRMRRWGSSDDSQAADSGAVCWSPGPAPPAGSAPKVGDPSPAVSPPSGAGDAGGRRVVRVLLRLSPVRGRHQRGEADGAGSPVRGCCDGSDDGGLPVDQESASDGALEGAAGQTGEPEVIAPASAVSASHVATCCGRDVTADHLPVPEQAREESEMRGVDQPPQCHGTGEVQIQHSDPQPPAAGSQDRLCDEAAVGRRAAAGRDDAVVAACGDSSGAVSAGAEGGAASSADRHRKPKTGSPRRRRGVRGLLSPGTTTETALATLEQRLAALAAAAAADSDAAAAAAAAAVPFPLRALTRPRAEIPAPNPDAFFQPDGSLLKGDVLRTACQVTRVAQLRSHLVIVPPSHRAAASGDSPRSMDEQAADLGAVAAAASGERRTIGSGSPAGTGAEGRRTVPLSSVLKLLCDFAGAARALERAESRLVGHFAAAAARATAAAAAHEAATAAAAAACTCKPEPAPAEVAHCHLGGDRCRPACVCFSSEPQHLDAQAAAAAEAAAAAAAAASAAELMRGLRALMPLMLRGLDGFAALLDAAERCISGLRSGDQRV